MDRCSCMSGIVLLIALVAGCQQAPPAPKVERKIDLLGDLQTRPAHVSTSVAIHESDGVVINTLGMRLVPVQPGTFQMGSPMNEAGRQDDEFRHEVRLTRRFHMAATEVTQAQWEKVMNTRPWHSGKGAIDGKDQPATHMTYAEAVRFCELLSRMENATYRLPTEAEWEFACRAGTGGAYASDNGVNDFAWTDANTPHNNASAVGRKKANALGLFDMHGNVAEWCADWYGPYARQAVTDPTGPSTGEYRVVRGGAWDSTPRFCRSAYRTGTDPATSSGSIGLRVVLIK